MNLKQRKKRLSTVLATTLVAGSISMPPFNVLAEPITFEEVLNHVTTGSAIEIIPSVTTPSQIQLENVLNVSELEREKIENVLNVGRYSIYPAASGTAVEIDGNNKQSDEGEAFTNRLKLAGSGSIDSRSVHFSTSGKATVTIYAMSSSGGTTRTLELYDRASNTKIGEADVYGDAEGNVIHKKVITVDQAGDYYLASKASGINIYKIVVEEEEETPLEPVEMLLEADKLPIGDIKQVTTINDFTMQVTDSKFISVDAHNKTALDGTSFAQRIKLNGTGSSTERSIHFATTGPATVEIYTMSGSSSADRKLNLCDAAGNVVASVDAHSTDLEKRTIEIKEAGNYYFVSPKDGISIYSIKVTMGEAPEVVRPEWSGVEAPVIRGAVKSETEKNTIDVSWSGLIGTDGADKITAKLYDQAGNMVSQKVTMTPGTEGTIGVTYTSSGEYTVVLEAARNDEEAVKTSEVYSVGNVLTDLPSVVTIASVLTGENNSLDVQWNAIDEIEHYEVAYKVAGEADSSYQIVQGATTELSCNISGLTVGTTYTIKVTGYRGEETVVGTVDKKVEAEKERWTSANVGSGAGGTVDVKSDGSITIDATGGKMADSEDGFTYYYTEIDPETENFTFTATFKMDNVDNRDNQSGFGIIALDTLVTGDSASRYYNSAGAMFTKLSETNNGVITSKYGFPGGRFITGYTGLPNNQGPTGSRKNIDSSVFDATYRDEEFAGTDLETKPRFFTGDEYTLTLRKSNTGYHASMTDAKTGEPIGEEVICYEPDLLLKQDDGKTYLGVFASRKIKVTVSDMEFTTIHPDLDDPKIERPVAYIDPAISYDATVTSSKTDYEAGFKANVNGTLEIKDANGQTLVTMDAKNKDRNTASLQLEQGDNRFTAVLTPAPREGQDLTEYEELSSYDPITIDFTVSHQKYGTSENALYVTPNGSASGEGTKASPLDIYTAVAYAQPGQEIVLLGGTYNLDKPIVIDRGNSGTQGQPIVLMSDPNERAIIDFSNSSSGFTLKGDYWHFYGFDIREAKKSPIRINGNNNIAEMLNIYNNADTGLQISGFSAESPSMWPSNNLVVSCESYNNADELGNDADGFAAKLTVGTGNVFRYCIAHHNVDDGWDLYAKSTTGPIGQVIVENSVTYANGSTMLNPSMIGEGNGFKLGGESVPGNHILRNSIAFGNIAKGITSNSGPDCQLFDNTSYGNGAENVSLYTNGATTNFVIQNMIASKGGKADKYDFKNQTWTNDGSVYIDGSNGAGSKVADSWFKSVDIKLAPSIAADGSIEMNGLLELTDKAEGKGAVFTANPNPTVIKIGKEIGQPDEQGPCDDCEGECDMIANNKWYFGESTFGTLSLQGEESPVTKRHGIIIDARGGKFHNTGRSDAQINSGTLVKVPVNGPSTLIIEHGHDKGTLKISDESGNKVTQAYDASGKWMIDTFSYTGTEAGYITLEWEPGSNFYMRNLEVKEAETQAKTIQVGPTAQYKTVQSALDSIDYAPTEQARVTLAIAPGVYEEEVKVTKPYITFKNADPSKGEVKITYDKASGHDSDPAKNKGTQDSASVTIAATATGFEAYDITFENSYNLGQDKLGDNPNDRKQTQAVAVVTLADQIIFENCKFLGRQDTLYLKGSSKGQTVQDVNEARVYLKDCYIEGTVDFIFGDSVAVFEDCELHMAYYTNGGHFTAPNTTLSNIGYVFNNCELTISEEYTEFIDPETGQFKVNAQGKPVKNIDLGRPWQADHTYPYYGSQSVFINSKMDKAITPNGWQAWDANTVTNKVRFMEYNTMDLQGNSVDLSARLDWVRVLQKAQADAYNTVNVLRGSDDWNPSKGDLNQPVQVADVTLNQYRLEVPAGESTTLQAKVLPVLASNNAVTWESSNPSVATVDANGVVTALGIGKAEITATTAENACSVKAEITVLAPRSEVPTVKEITIQAGESILPGDVLVGSYSYDLESDNVLDNAKVQWFIVDPQTGEEMLVQEGTEAFDREYRVASGDIGYQIKFAVIPETTTTYGNTGDIVKSEATVAVAKPDYTVPELYVRESFTNFEDKYEDVQHFNQTKSQSEKKWLGTNVGKAGNNTQTALTLLNQGEAASSGKSAWKIVDTSGRPKGDAEFNGNAAIAANIEYQNDASILVYNADKEWTNYTANARVRFSPLATGFSAASYWDMYIDYNPVTNSGYKLRISRGGNTSSAVATLYRVVEGVETLVDEDKTTLANKLKQNAGEENPFFRVEMSNRFGEIKAKIYFEGTDENTVELTFLDENPLSGTVAFENFGKTGCPIVDMLTVEEILGDTTTPEPEPEIDQQAPILHYTGERVIRVGYGKEFVMPEVTATDNVDDMVEVTYSIKDSKGVVVQSINTRVPGEYTITYTAKDQAGNMAEDLHITVIVANRPSTDDEIPPNTTTPEVTEPALPSVDESIADSIENGEVPTVEVGTDNKVEVSAQLLGAIIDANTELVVKGQGISITLNPYFLNSSQVIGTSENMEVLVTPVDAKMMQQITEHIQLDSQLSMLGENSQIFELGVKVGTELKAFNEPLSFTFDLSKDEVEQGEQLTLVRYDQQEDGSLKVVKLGGRYNPETQSFTALTDKPGCFGIVKAEELLKINLAVGNAVVEVNGEEVVQDVMPHIVEGRTMVPLRMIAESLNAEVKWDAKRKQVSIIVDDTVIQLPVADSEYSAIIKDNRTYVPIRYISEQLDANVLWVPSAKAIEIVK